MRAVSLLLIALAASACGGGELSRDLGARCEAKADCDERCLPPSTVYPGGLCTRSCVDDGDCPDGSRCAADEGGVCLFACADQAGCGFLGEGWTCASRRAARDVDEEEVEVCRGE